MSLYQLQKMLFHTLSDPRRRDEYRQSPERFAEGYELDAAERTAVLCVDIRALYRMGVDPLLLRPFTELNRVKAADHYAALRGLE